MSRESYQKRMNALLARPGLLKALRAFGSFSTAAVFCAYPLILLRAWLDGGERFLHSLLTPAIGFVLVSLGRKALNRPRPYEVYGLPSALPKNTRGRSFPSRHVFSAFMIAFAARYVFPCGAPAACLLVLSCVLAVLRVVTGVHFLRDVLCGAALAALAAWLGFVIL